MAVVDKTMQPDPPSEKRMVANPTATEFASMLSEHKAALSALLNETPDAAGSEERCSKAYAALVTARPRDPAVMAMQLRWLLSEIEVGDCPDYREVLEHIAHRLEALAAGLLLSGNAARQVREALLHALDELEEQMVTSEPGSLAPP